MVFKGDQTYTHCIESLEERNRETRRQTLTIIRAACYAPPREERHRRGRRPRRGRAPPSEPGTVRAGSVRRPRTSLPSRRPNGGPPPS